MDYVQRIIRWVNIAIYKVLGMIPEKNSTLVFPHLPFLIKWQGIERSWLGEPRVVLFENKEFPTYSEYDPIFKIFYGDYMSLPPEKDRKAHIVEFSMAEELGLTDRDKPL